MNNNSNDGTKSWLNWIKESNIPYFEKVIPINLNINHGDWGGMIESLKYISDDSEYIVQLDNDIEIKDNDWINKCIYLLENTNSQIVQLKRIGVKQNVIPNRIRTIAYNNDVLNYGNINRPVAMFMLKTNDFKKVKDKLPLDLSAGKTRLSQFLGNKTVKITNLKCYIMDGYDGVISLNYKKYPHKNVHRKR